LALVGDTADGYPGLPGWGPKSAAQVLARFGHLESIPANPADWDVPVRGAARLSAALEAHGEAALLFRTLATLRIDAPVSATIDELKWRGPTAEFEQVARDLGAPGLWDRCQRIRRLR
jgi:5'-3' exonuclease